MTVYCLQPDQSTEFQVDEKKSALGRLVFSLILLTCLLGVGGFYLWQTNSFVSDGYYLDQLKKEQQVLEDEKRDLLLALADFQSLKNLKQRSQDLSLVEVEEMSYLSLPSSVPSVALLVPVSD